MMGSLTGAMTRLRDEISALRDARAKAAIDLRHMVSTMQAGFRQSHEEMARETKAERIAFISGLKRMVLGMRREFAADLAGARRAWVTMSATR